MSTKKQQSAQSKELLTAIHRLLHRGRDWLWCENLRTGTGYRQTEGYLDAWAMHLYPSRGNIRTTYEVKISRTDFTRELRQPAKRRVGMMVSNHFFFVAPRGILKPDDIPVGCGLLEVEIGETDYRQHFRNPRAAPRAFTADKEAAIVMTLPAPWRDTPPPPWIFLGAVARCVSNGRK